MDRVVPVDQDVPTDATGSGSRDHEAAMGRHDRRLVAGLVAVVWWPILVAVLVLSRTRWYPLLDWAQTEIRVRDVFSSRAPLIGLAGRIGPYGPEGGSHPGPISFYLLWPAWMLSGKRAYGMNLGVGFFDLAAIGLACWMGYRRGRLVVASGVAAALAVLLRTYGAFMVTTPWNPYMPAIWWYVFLLAVWSVLDEDWAMLPIAVFAGTFCMQTHISYLGLVGGLAACVVAFVALRAWRGRRGARAAGDVHPGSRSQMGRWLVIAVVLGAVLWAPPVVDQVRYSPGNAATIRDHFTNPPEEPIGLREGAEVFAAQLNVATLAGPAIIADGRQRPPQGASIPGVLLIAVWLGSVVGAARLGLRSLLRLDAVLGVSLLLGLISAARIFGQVWFYLLLWAWALTVLLALAVVWTVLAWIGARLDAETRPRMIKAATAAAIAITVVASVVNTYSSAQIEVMAPRLNQQLSELAPGAAAALAEGERNGVRGPYLVTWLPDAQGIGAEGFGLLNELLRGGFDVVAYDTFRPGATRHHVTLDPERTTLEVHLATGFDIERWRAMPGSKEVSFSDPRTPDERVEFDRLRGEVIAEIQQAGLVERVDDVDGNLFMLAIAPEVPKETRTKISRMLALGMPAAVFVVPPGVSERATR